MFFTKLDEKSLLCGDLCDKRDRQCHRDDRVLDARTIEIRYPLRPELMGRYEGSEEPCQRVFVVVAAKTAHTSFTAGLRVYEMYW